MKLKHHISISFVILLTACVSPTPKKKKIDHSVLSQAERLFFIAQQLDSTLVNDLRPYTKVSLEAFNRYLLDSDDFDETSQDVFLEGFVFEEKSDVITNLQDELSEEFKQKGYSMIIVEEDFGEDNNQSVLAILKTRNKYKVLSQLGTNGINYNIDTDSLIQIIKTFDEKYDLELLGANYDWCYLQIGNENTDWMQFAAEVLAVCPDVVDEGDESVQILADEMEAYSGFYLWWD